MVFFFIACYQKDQTEEALKSRVNSTLQGNKTIGEFYSIEVDKLKFKVGTLDSLMELNETLQKVDNNLDAVVKKVEKQAKELVQEDLMIEMG